ncbi:MAG: protoporphyrinogen oxidase, partial [Planctomycetota bacterium]
QPAALQLTKEFGCEANLIAPQPENRLAQVLHSGEIHPIPNGFSLMQPTRLRAILSTSTLSWTGTLRLLSEYFVSKRASDEDESLESFATRRLGRETFENLVEPIVGGIFTADPSRLSMQAAMPQFWQMESNHGGLIRAGRASRKSAAGEQAKKASGARYDQFRAPQQGMSQWVSELARHIPETNLSLRSSVQSIAKRGMGGYELHGSKTSEVFDAVLFATPAAATGQLLHNINAEAAKTIGAIQYASSVVVAFVLDRSQIGADINSFGLIIPRKEQRPVLAVSYSSNKYAGRVSEDKILLRLFFGGAQHPEFINQADDNILALAQDELRLVLKWRGEKPEYQSVIRWPDAMPQYNVGHLDRVETARSSLLRTDPAIRVSGAAYNGVGIPQCVQSGRQAAVELVEQLRAKNATY